MRRMVVIVILGRLNFSASLLIRTYVSRPHLHRLHFTTMYRFGDMSVDAIEAMSKLLAYTPNEKFKCFFYMMVPSTNGTTKDRHRYLLN